MVQITPEDESAQHVIEDDLDFIRVEAELQLIQMIMMDVNRWDEEEISDDGVSDIFSLDGNLTEAGDDLTDAEAMSEEDLALADDALSNAEEYYWDAETLPFDDDEIIFSDDEMSCYEDSMDEEDTPER